MNPAGQPNLEEWIAGQWDGYTLDELLGVLLAQPLGAEGDGLREAERIVERRLGELLPQVRQLTQSPDARAREVSVLLLGQLSVPVKSKLQPEACGDSIIAVLAIETEPAVLSACACSLGRLEDPRIPDHLPGLALHPDAYVRSTVACWLSGCDDPRAIEALALMAEDTDEDTRSWATFALSDGDTDTPEVRRVLAEHLNDVSDIRDRVVYGLTKRGDVRATPWVLWNLNEGYEREYPSWCDVFEALGEVCAAWADGSRSADPAWVPVLERAVEREVGDTETIQAALARCRSAAP